MGVISTIAIVVWKLSRQNSKIEDLSEDLNGLRQCSETIYNIQTEIALIKTNQKNINDTQLRLIEKQDERLTKIEDVADADCVIVAVAHNEFRALSLTDIKKMFKTVPDAEKVLIDVKGLYKIEDLKASGMQWWRL